jgi:site-specific DNA-methyltransferase (adenine-specific)
LSDEIRVIHGDCLDVLPTLEPGSVDCVVTSPPYNQLGGRVPMKSSGLMANNRWVAKVNAKGYADDMSEPDYRSWLASVADALGRAVRPGGSLFFNHKIRYRDGEMFHPIDYVREWEGWDFRQEIIWDVAAAIAFNCGLFAPVEERVYWLVKAGAKPGWNPGAAGMLSLWRIDRNRHIKGSVKGHPCPFPVELPKRCIEAVTLPGEVILDPFAGSGSTLIAALKSGRRAIGIEIDERYIPIIHRRLKDAETPLFQGVSE